MSVAIRPSEEQPLTDDLALATAAADGDGAAFTQLLRRHDDNMRGVVWRVVASPTVMDDVLQDAYLNAWRAMPNWRGDAAFSSWLYRIVYNAAIDAVRRRPALSVAGDGENRRDKIVPDHASSIADDLALRSALASLPSDQLAVIALIEGEGRSYDDVARLLDISPGTVGSRLHRARASLRAELATPSEVSNEDWS